MTTTLVKIVSVAVCVELAVVSGAQGQLDLDGRGRLLAKYSPVFVPNDGEGQAICDLMDYVDGGRVLATDGKNRWMKSSDGDERWTAEEFVEHLKGSASARRESASWEVEPRSGIRNSTLNPTKRDRGAGIFGHVRHLQGDLYSVKYFLFLAWNETTFSGGEGGHEGDWLCVDFQVRVPERNGEPQVGESRIEYGLYHNHGRVFLVEPEEIQWTEEGRPYAFMENGTNELFPNTGKRGFGGWAPGLKATKCFDCGKGFGSEHKIVRSHQGTGVPYDTIGKVQNLETSQSDSAWLFLNYRGQWGENDIDDTGMVDVTNPRSPRFQPKMWDRSFARDPNDPRIDPSWLPKPACS